MKDLSRFRVEPCKPIDLDLEAFHFPPDWIRPRILTPDNCKLYLNLDGEWLEIDGVVYEQCSTDDK